MDNIPLQIASAVAEQNGYKSPEDVKLLCCYDLFDGNHYAVTDWHMWIKDRETDVKPTPVRARDKYEEILEKYRNIFKQTDLNVVINLGDIVDDEFYEFFSKEEQIAIFDDMFGDTDCYKKYLIKGNNDHWDHEFLYERYGWIMVDAIYCEHYILSHLPLNLQKYGLEEFTNVHGHYHGTGIYWTVPFTRHLDLWTIGRDPFKIDKCDIAEAIKDKSEDIKDVFHLGLKTKADFTAYRGVYKYDNEI